MLPAHMQQALHSSKHNDNTSPFFTEAFHSLVKQLACGNSVAALHGFVLTTSGINSAMRAQPYLGILYQNLRLTPKTSGILASSRKGDHIQVWGTELFTRILLRLPSATRSAMKVPIQDLARRLASELLNIFQKNHICEVYSAQYLAYVQKEISCYLRHSHVEIPVIDEHTIARECLGILNDMSSYYSTTKHRKLCLLLTFFGTNFDTGPDVYSSKILREVLHYSQNVALSASQDLSPHEAYCREQIFTIIQRALKRISTRIEKAESFVTSTFPWYCIFKKLQQMFYALFTIPVLTHVFHTVKETDAAYKASIMFGDCLEFFSSLREIETTLNCSIEDTSALFTALHEIQRTYKVAPHVDYISSVRACTTGYRALPICSGTYANCNRLKHMQHKIRSSFNAIRDTTSTFAGSSVVAKALAKLRNKAPAPKTHLSAVTAEGSCMTSANTSLQVDRPSAAHAHYTPECTAPSNDNNNRCVKQSKRKAPSWRKHLLKKAHRLLSPDSSTFLHRKKLGTYTGMCRAMSIRMLQTHSHYAAATSLPQSTEKQHSHSLTENSANSFGEIVDIQNLGKVPSRSSISSLQTDESSSIAPLYKPALQSAANPSKKGKKLSFLARKSKKAPCRRTSIIGTAANDSSTQVGSAAQGPVSTPGDAQDNDVPPDSKVNRSSALFRLLLKTTQGKEIAM